tara:strand:+ start:1436 stop:1705 length:270 start_codon:yes stop_codon:yes gene_type:complete
MKIMQQVSIQIIFSFWFLLLFPFASDAYIGPGLGAGTIGVVIGILASIVLGFFAIIWYPIRRLIKKKKAFKSSSSGDLKGQDSNNPTGL